MKQLESEIEPEEEDLDKQLESLRAELATLQKAKKARSASLERIGVDNSQSTTYSVLKYNDQSVTHEGDSLMLSLGSTQ